MGDVAKDQKKKTSWFKGLEAELKKIIWADKKSVARQTTAVIAVSVFLGLLITVLDFIIQYGVDILVNL